MALVGGGRMAMGGCKTGNSCAHWNSIALGEIHSEEHQNLIYGKTYEMN